MIDRLLLLLFLTLPLVAGADNAAGEDATDAVAEPPPLDISFTASDLPWLIGLALFFLLFVGFIVYKFWTGSSTTFQQIDLQERLFERELLKEAEQLAQTSVTPAPAPIPGPAAAKPAEPRTSGTVRSLYPSQAATQPVAIPTGNSDSAPATVDQLVKRLVQLTVLADREGQLNLAIPPHAPIYRLRKGGHMVILPRLESHAVLVHCCRRFDVVVVAGETDQDIIIMGRLESQLRTLMERPGDFEPMA